MNARTPPRQAELRSPHRRSSHFAPDSHHDSGAVKFRDHCGLMRAATARMALVHVPVTRTVVLAQRACSPLGCVRQGVSPPDERGTCCVIAPDACDDCDTRNPGRERPRTAPGPHLGARGGVVHVLGSVSALIGTATTGGIERRPICLAAHRASPCTRTTCLRSTSAGAGVAEGIAMRRRRVKEPG